MKALNSSEVESIGQVLEGFQGYRLQEVESLSTGCLLRLYGDGKSIWLIAEMNPARPILLPLSQRPRVSKSTKPLGLFINANLVGQTLTGIEYVTSRVLKLLFSHGAIEFRLFPHGENIIVKVGKKSISWEKIAELKPAHHEDKEGRSIAEIIRQWEERLPPTKKTPAVKAGVGSSLEKKKIALQKILEEIEAKSSQKWGAAGEFLKREQTMKVPAEFDGYIDFKSTLAENIQICFRKAKDLERKILASRVRARIIKEEITKLEAAATALEVAPSVEAEQPTKKNLAIKDSNLKLRKLELQDGQIAYMGKSAADNISLLRGAQPWDCWIHMKDYPGAHVIVRRHRGQETSPADIEKAARWLASETPSSKRELREGDRFEIQLSECRFVKPLKGDRLGRVSVAKPKVLRFKF